MSKMPKYLVIAKSERGAVVYRNPAVEAYTAKGAIEIARGRDDGMLADRSWPGLTWNAEQIKKAG